MFVTVNCYFPLATDDNCHALSEPHTNNIIIDEEDQSTKKNYHQYLFVEYSTLSAFVINL